MVTFARFVFLFSCLVVSNLCGANADAPGVHLVRQAGNDHINALDEQFHRRMKWSHGGYLVMDRIGGQPPVFYSLDRDGNWNNTAQVQNPEPAQFYVYSYDRQSNGTIVFSGATETAPRVLFPFLAWTSADGKSQRLLHSDHYFPYQVAVAPDDTIWTLGYEMLNLNHNDPAVNKEAHVLRHFDSAGNLIGSALPQSQLNRYQLFCVTTGRLAAARDRLGWYGSRETKAVYTEISVDTMNMREYPGVPSNSKYPFTEGVAVTNNGVAAVSIQDQSAGVRTNYVLDRASSKWVPVSIPPMGGFKFTPILIGSDEDNLVFKYGREAGFFSVLQ